MNPFMFAGKYLNPYKVRGNEIIPRYCPFCKGGRNKDTDSFALNTEKLTYNCKRASCGVAGTFSQLLVEYGENRSYEFSPAQPRSYTPPKTKIEPVSKVEAYLKKRGFSKETWEKRKVGENSGKIVFPYYEDNKLVLIKFREPKKKGKWNREPGGKPVFWGMEHCAPWEPLTITEGEFDCLALEEAGIENCVSIPSGASDLSCVENCWDWLQQFKNIYIWPDTDEPGMEMCRKLVAKLGEARCYIIHTDYKDANECLYNEGVEGVRKAYGNAKAVPLSGIVRLADVKALDVKNLEKVKSGFKGLDKITGGFYLGQVSVWTGINASGKSTALGQVLIESVDQGYTVCAFSGELPAPMFRYWIDLQSAGPDNLEGYYDDFKEDIVYFVPEKHLTTIRDWYRYRFFLHENFGASTEDEIIKVFEYAAMRYNAKIFMVDNLMTTIFTSNDKDFYRQQTNFIGRICDFSKKHECHVHVVAHPRKTEGRLTKMDVAGSGGITNRADNVFSFHRIKDSERDKLPEKLRDCDNVIDVFKNRFGGKQDVSVGLKFEPASKRFYMKNEQANKKYGWEDFT